MWPFRRRRSNEEEWQKIFEIADRLRSPHDYQIYVAKDYTKHDLRIDLLTTIPLWVKRKRPVKKE